MSSEAAKSIDGAISILLCQFAVVISDDDDVLELEYLRSKWRRIDEWATRAEQFLKESDGSGVNDSRATVEIERLKDAIDEARAELSTTPESLMNAAAQAARGEGIPASELRVELRSRSQKHPIAG